MSSYIYIRGRTDGQTDGKRKGQTINGVVGQTLKNKKNCPVRN